MVGLVGLALVLVAGITVLVGVRLQGVEAVMLVDVADDLGGLATDPATFDVEAATRLGAPRSENDRALTNLRRRFFAVALGLLLEVAGLAVAAEIPAPAKPKPPVRVALHLTRARLRRASVTLAGRVAPGSRGGTLVVVVTLHGRAAQAASSSAAVPAGHFAIRIGASPSLRPLRSATYTVTWTGPRGARIARLSGIIVRGP